MKRPRTSCIVFFLTGALFIYCMNALTDKVLEFMGLPDWIAAVIFLVLLLAFMKRIFVSAVALDIEIKQSVPDYHPWLDSSRLSEITADFESLGFEWQGDYVLIPKSSRGMKAGFFRLFIHPEQMCYVEISQAVMINGTTVPMYFEILSELNGGRFVSTVARKPTASRSIIRHPNAAVKYVTETPAELIKTHLQQRNEVMDQCNAEINEDLSSEAYIAQQRNYLRDIVSILKKKSMFILPVEIIYYSRHPITEWRGKRVRKPDVM